MLFTLVVFASFNNKKEPANTTGNIEDGIASRIDRVTVTESATKDTVVD